MMNQNLIQIFYNSADKNGIPNINKEDWKALNKSYNKEEIIEGLIQYIKKYDPDAPRLRITYNEMVRNFHSLRAQPYTKFMLKHAVVKDQVMEKYPDYKRPYKDYGLGVIQMGNSYLDVSNYFNQLLRMNCDSYGYKSPHYRWKNHDNLREVFLCLWRLGNDKLNEYSFVVAFRLATYIATQFKPHVAKTVYDMTGADVVFDASCGWGDRLAGFFCSNASQYYGCDPNGETYDMYVKQCMTYFELLGEEYIFTENASGSFTMKGKTKSVQIWRSPAEDLDYTKLPPIDCAFTSPPYFSTELYAQGSKYENDQSWKRYDSYEKWRDWFFIPVNERIHDALAPNGLNIVNIQDPKIGVKRYHASDDLIDHMSKYKDCKFLGQLGMRIMQRPKNVSKEKLTKHFKGIYTEPMWAFSKGRTDIMNTVNLESLMT
jgi:hypothetical protein